MRQNTSFSKETTENADLHKAVWSKTMTSQEQCVKYDFVYPLKAHWQIPKNYVLKNIVHVTKHVNFYLYKVHPDRVI